MSDACLAAALLTSLLVTTPALAQPAMSAAEQRERLIRERCADGACTITRSTTPGVQAPVNALAQPALTDVSVEDLSRPTAGPIALDRRVELRVRDDGTLRSLWGVGMAIPLSDSRCERRTPARSAACFLRRESALGLDRDDLFFSRMSTLDDGRTIVRFRQFVEGARVRGAEVIVTLDRTQTAVTRVFASVFPEVEVTGTRRGRLQRDARRAGVLRPRRQARRALRPGDIELVIDAERAGPAVMRWRDIVAREGGDVAELWSLDRDQLMVTEPLTANAPWEALTQLTLLEVTDQPCSSHAECFPILQCLDPPAYPEHPQVCYDRCLVDQHCVDVFGAAWSCASYDEDTPFYCYGADETVVVPVATDAAGYADNREGDAYLYWHTEMFEQFVDFMETDYGRDGWDDLGGTFRLLIKRAPQQPEQASGGKGTMRLNRFLDFDTFWQQRRAWFLFGHEGVHSVHSDPLTGESLGHAGCLTEPMAQLGSGLYVRDKMGSASEVNANTGALYTGWYDTQTLKTGKGPYVFRSWFDRMPCDGPLLASGVKPCSSNAQCGGYEWCAEGTPGGPKVCAIEPYRYNQGEMWNRAFRLFWEGPDVLEQDGEGEVVGGLPYEGVGKDAAIDVAYDGWQQLIAGSSDERDYADAIYSAAAANDTLFALMQAAGSAGIPEVPKVLPAIESPFAPRAARWPEAVYSIDGQALASTTAAGDVLLHMNIQGAGWQSIAMGVDADGPPTVIVFDGLLHLFWVDASSGDVGLRVFTSTLAATTYNLGDAGMTVVSGIDAVIANSELKVALPTAGASATGGWLKMATCAAPPCAPDAWMVSTPAVSWPAAENVGLTFSDDVHGTDDGGYLYLFTHGAVSFAGTDSELFVVRFTLDGELVDWRSMPEHFFEHVGDASTALAITARPSLHTDEGDLLALSWRDSGSGKIVHALLRDWAYEVQGTQRGWFTRPTPLDAPAVSGPSFAKGEPPWYLRTLWSTSPTMAKQSMLWANH